ncbi:MAG: glycosyltransferase [Roseibium sp.]|uniref:glycosyltransferase n=1 Tax=Roseibium sp. TaxID=1936156 RepID=UPI003D9C1A42
MRSMFKDHLDFLKQHRKIIIANYDDLIFGNTEIAMESSAVKNKTMMVDEAIKAFQSNLEALQLFDRVVVSTEPLASMVRLFNPDADVQVSPNFLPNSMIALHKELSFHERFRYNNTIGYFAGTLSHNRDFPIVEPVLHRILMENPELNLIVVGPVKLPRSLSALPNVTVTGVRPFQQLPGLMAACSTAIAPLENSTFNRCKSRVKFLEAALTGVRLVSSPIPDMQAIGEPHLILADTHDDWYSALSEPPVFAAFRPQAKTNFDRIAMGQDVSGFEILGNLA